MSLEAKKIVFTGKLSKRRDAMAKEAREAGLIVRISLSDKIDWLICGEKSSLHTSTQEAAQSFGAEILDETEYRKRLQGSTDSK